MPDSGINWGLLQTPTPQASIRTATPQGGGEIPAAPNGDQALAQQQEVAIEKQRLAMEQQRQPGLLQQTQLQNQGLALDNTGKGTENQKAALQLKLLQQEATFHQADLQAYQKGGLPAYQKALESHDPDSAAKLQAGIADANVHVADANVKMLTNTANLAHTIVGTNYNPLNAQSRNELMQRYMMNKDLLKQLNPNMPDMKTPEQVSNWAMGVTTTAYGWMQTNRAQQQLAMDSYKAQAAESAKTTGAIDTDAIKNANVDAAKAQESMGSINAYTSMLNQVQSWNKANPTKQVPIGYGFQALEQSKKIASAVGFSTDILDKMEQLQGAQEGMFANALTSLKTMPRSAAVIKPFEDALANPSDTAGAQQTKMQAIEYASKVKINYADFLQQYRAANGNTTGAQAQWSKFLSSDPSLQSGGLPNPSYVDQQNYMPWLNQNYNPTTSKAGAGQITPDMAKQELMRRGVIK